MGQLSEELSEEIFRVDVPVTFPVSSFTCLPEAFNRAMCATVILMKGAYEIEEARTQFVEVIRYRPDFAMAHLNLGLMLAKQEKLEQALAEFRITLQLDPTNQLAQQYLETTHAAKGRGSAGEFK